MFDIWQSISQLRQQCLSRPMPEAFLDTDKTVKPELLKSLDALLWEHVLNGFVDWQPLKHPQIHLSNSQKWLNISALQKAIRRGQVTRAIQFARQGCMLDADYVFRRIAVCALEDIGIGNFLAVACCLAVLGDKRRRRDIGEANLAAYLAQMLAESPKSRLACDLLSLVEYNPRLKPIITEWASASDTELANNALNQSMAMDRRMLATWLLAGTHRFHSNLLPKSNYRQRSSIMQEMTKARMPLILYYIADKGAARASDALFCSYLQIWNIVKNQYDFELLNNEISNSEIINDFPVEAYDMHTREGRIGISRFRNYLERDAALPQPFTKDIDLGNILFRVEGGLLDREVINEDILKISNLAEGLEILGMPDYDNSLSRTLIKHIPTLHEIRRQIAVSLIQAL